MDTEEERKSLAHFIMEYLEIDEDEVDYDLIDEWLEKNNKDIEIDFNLNKKPAFVLPISLPSPNNFGKWISENKWELRGRFMDDLLFGNYKEQQINQSELLKRYDEENK